MLKANMQEYLVVRAIAGGLSYRQTQESLGLASVGSVTHAIQSVCRTNGIAPATLFRRIASGSIRLDGRGADSGPDVLVLDVRSAIMAQAAKRIPAACCRKTR